MTVRSIQNVNAKGTVLRKQEEEKDGFTNYVHFIGYQESEKEQTTIPSFFTPIPSQPKSRLTVYPQADQPSSIIIRGNPQREREEGKQRE